MDVIIQVITSTFENYFIFAFDIAIVKFTGAHFLLVDNVLEADVAILWNKKTIE
jgi:hypothetical protein